MKKSTTCKVHQRPEMEFPVYRVVIEGKSYFIQRMNEMNSGSAWYRVAKKKGYWNVFDKDKNPHNVYVGFLGFTKAEAIEELEKQSKKSKK